MNEYESGARSHFFTKKYYKNWKSALKHEVLRRFKTIMENKIILDIDEYFDLLKDSFYAWALSTGGVTDWAWHDEALNLFIRNHLALITDFHKYYNEDENETVSFDDFTTWLANRKIEEKLKKQENSHG